MPEYSFFCESCKIKFEIFCSIKEYSDSQKCTKCNKSKNTHRLYQDDLSSLSTCVKKSDSDLKTIGDLANRNRDKMSEDQKNDLYHAHNSYKEETSKKDLPSGMTRIPKPKQKIKWRKNG